MYILKHNILRSFLKNGIIAMAPHSGNPILPLCHLKIFDDGIVLRYENFMSKEKLVDILKGILLTDADLSFLLQLKVQEIETLIACIRERVDQTGNQ